MFETDNSTLNGRKQALDALAAMPMEELEPRFRQLVAAPIARPVRGPEIGAMMVRGRIGGGGDAFNLGETSITRATVKLDSGEVGHSVILGRDKEKARIIAHLDALRQKPEWADHIDSNFVQPSLAMQAEARRKRAEETEATRVDFFTMVRGEDK